MVYQNIPIQNLIINPENDRHGRVDSEKQAIAHLFQLLGPRMKNLAMDIVANGGIMEPPLVIPQGTQFLVEDGNRRTTCLKLICDPSLAPNKQLVDFFSELNQKAKPQILSNIICRVETDKHLIDEILFRRHNGAKAGIGQVPWGDREKRNFEQRTGKYSGLNVADHFEQLLESKGKLPDKKIPRSTFNRMFSSEKIRNAAGFSLKNDEINYECEKDQVVDLVAKIAEDMALGDVTLKDVWNNADKINYLSHLQQEGFSAASSGKPPTTKRRSEKKVELKKWDRIIPEVDFEIPWKAETRRQKEIWEELQFQISVKKCPNAVAVLLRVLLELSFDYYLSRHTLPSVDQHSKLTSKCQKIAEHLFERKLISRKQKNNIEKLRQGEKLISIDTLNNYVHSTDFYVSPEHLGALWQTLSEVIVICLKD